MYAYDVFFMTEKIFSSMERDRLKRFSWVRMKTFNFDPLFTMYPKIGSRKTVSRNLMT